MAKKILLVDDDPHIVQLLKTRLAASQYEIVTASDGEEGFEKLKAESPDMVLLDILMPKMDGYGFVLRMKEENLLSKTPVIMLTAKDNMKDLFEMEGVSDYIVKPFQAAELLNKIEAVFKKRAG
ncbi:MAG TPA: response regulator [Candidatus Omnitrophota bacterium]|nr:response regulator [Candidatus Omnitrophota bacterium]